MKKLLAVILSLGLIIAPVPTAYAAGGSGGYANQILGLANGVMGGSILLKCKLGATQWSVMTYMAGSLVYLAGEMLGGKTQAKKQKDQAANLDQTKETMKEGGDYQRAMIQAQLDDEKTTLSTIQKRRKWIMATKVVYAAATALALLETWWKLPTPAGLNKPDGAGCSPDGGSHKPLELALIAAYSGLQSSGGSIKGAAMGMAMGALMKFVLKIEIGDMVADKAISLLSSSIGRIVFFAAATALVLMIDKDLKKSEEDSKKRIADLEKVKAQFDEADNSLAEGSVDGGVEGGANGEGTSAPNLDPTKQQYAVKALPKGELLPKHCYSNSGGGVTYSEAACKTPMKLTKPNFSLEMNVPALVAGANTAHDMAQAVANGDMARADIEAGNLAAMAGRIGAIKDDLMKKTNERLVKEGKKPIDVDAEIQRQLTALNAGLNQANPGSGNYTMADLNTNGAETSADEIGKVDTTASDITTASAPVATPIGTADGLDLTGIGEGVEDGSINGSGTDNANEVASLTDKLSEFESNESDIATDSSVSIFKQVSNRYFLNYTKIFDRKKQIAPPLKEAPVNP